MWVESCDNKMNYICPSCNKQALHQKGTAHDNYPRRRQEFKKNGVGDVIVSASKQPLIKTRWLWSCEQFTITNIVAGLVQKKVFWMPLKTFPGA